jgi:hypothetical protein
MHSAAFLTGAFSFTASFCRVLLSLCLNWAVVAADLNGEQELERRRDPQFGFDADEE